MAGGAHGHEGDTLPPPCQLVQRRQAGTRGTAGRRPRVGPGVGVRVDVPATAGAERLELGQVRRRVHPGHLVDGRLADGGVHDLVPEPEGTDPVHDREKA